MSKICPGAVFLTVLICSPALSQVRQHQILPANQRPQTDTLASNVPGQLPLTPSGYGGSASDYARAPYGSVPYDLTPSCNESRRASKASMYQARRAAEQQRREASRKTLGTLGKVLSEEELAASKFQLAHLFWTAGKIDAARNQLAKLLDDFPSTQAADRARRTLARL